MSGTVCPQYRTGFYAPKRGGIAAYPSLWRGCKLAIAGCLGPTGLVARDWSPSADHGVLTSVTASSLWLPSQGRYAMNFNAGNERVMLSEAWSIISGASTYSVSVWFNADSLANSPVLISNVAGSGTGGFNDFFIELASSGTTMYWGNGNSLPFRTYTTTAYAVGTWNHLAVVKTGTGDSGKLYLNGIEQTSFSGSLSTPRVFNGDIALGYYSNNTVSFDGKLDDVLFYDRMLRARQVRILARRRGIAYELAPHRRASSVVQLKLRRSLSSRIGSRSLQ